MKVRSVRANNRRKAFEVSTSGGVLAYPYAQLRHPPTRQNRIAEAHPDPELAREAFTYILEDGTEDSIHVEEVLEYNRDPDYLRDLMLYKLTLEAQSRVADSELSKREIIRRLGTSASQFYRLLDQTNYSKSVGQLLRLLAVLGCEVELVVRDRKRRSA